MSKVDWMRAWIVHLFFNGEEKLLQRRFTSERDRLTSSHIILYNVLPIEKSRHYLSIQEISLLYRIIAPLVTLQTVFIDLNDLQIHSFEKLVRSIPKRDLSLPLDRRYLSILFLQFNVTPVKFRCNASTHWLAIFRNRASSKRAQGFSLWDRS